MPDLTTPEILAKAGVLAKSDCYYVHIESICNQHPTFKVWMRDIHGNMFAFVGEQVFSNDQAEKLTKTCNDLGQPLIVVDLTDMIDRL